MLYSFFESVKYVGHMYPVALMRIYLGYFYLDSALERLHGTFLRQPQLAATIMDHLPQAQLPIWYADLLQYFVVRNWQIFAYIIVYCEFLIGIALLVGFLVRPASILGVFLMINFIFATGPASLALQQTFLALFIVMFWLGAGRCLGLDYYFYKRQRGFWW